MHPSADDIEQALIRLLSSRAEDASICPSEVARALDESEDTWREWMCPVRVVAGRLSRQGVVEVTQRGGEVVEIENAVGPVRLRRGKRFADSVRQR